MRRVVFLAILLCATTAQAVQFTGSQTGANTWTYNVTVDPLDNYSVCQPNTTITINGLTGVTAAAGPTSSDNPNPGLVAIQLAWTAAVTNGGTTVVFTHVGLGSGNFGTPFHINGFTITATATSGAGSFATSGFEKDGTCPTQDLDITGTVPAPSTTPLVVPSVPALTPAALLALGIVLSIVALVALRR